MKGKQLSFIFSEYLNRVKQMNYCLHVFLSYIQYITDNDIFHFKSASIHSMNIDLVISDYF